MMKALSQQLICPPVEATPYGAGIRAGTFFIKGWSSSNPPSLATADREMVRRELAMTEIFAGHSRAQPYGLASRK
jgi:hypothetical protein